MPGVSPSDRTDLVLQLLLRKYGSLYEAAAAIPGDPLSGGRLVLELRKPAGEIEPRVALFIESATGITLQ